MNIGILSAGGVCPGVNTVIRSITLHEKRQGNRVYGFNEGFRGVNYNMKSRINTDDLNEGAGTILRTSYDGVIIDNATKYLDGFDRLYCICGNGSMKDAANMSQHPHIHTNIIGIAKSIYDDIPKIESLGFQTAVQEIARYIDCVYTESSSTNSVVFLETPEKESGKLAMYSSLARLSKVDVVMTPEAMNNDFDFEIRNKFLSQGHVVVVVSQACDYESIVKGLDMETKILKPSYLIRDREPCVYDNILANRMANEAFIHAQTERDFIKGATGIVSFKDYLEIV
jgi:6-phosphofructokinase 1